MAASATLCAPIDRIMQSFVPVLLERASPATWQTTSSRWGKDGSPFPVLRFVQQEECDMATLAALTWRGFWIGTAFQFGLV